MCRSFWSNKLTCDKSNQLNIIYICACVIFVDIIICILFVGRGQSISCDNFLSNPIAVLFDSRYLEFDGTMEKIRVNRSSTQEELWKYRKCRLFNDERETTRAKFWRAKTCIACLDSRNDLKLIRCFCCCFFSVKFFESCGMTDNC